MVGSVLKAIMVTDKKLQLTKQGHEALKIELENLLEKKRPELVERLANARGEGDLSENSDYQNAKEEMEFLDGRIAELGEVIKNAVQNQNRKGGGR